MIRDEYIRHATVVRVVDGDTVDVDLDLGCGVTKRERLRLYGINSPEMRGAERSMGIEARRHIVDLILKHRLDTTQGRPQIIVQTFKDKKGKYGRYIASLFGINPSGGRVNLNLQMVTDGHAVVAKY